MILSDILHNINTRLNITSLHAMQQQLIDDNAPSVILIAPTGSGKTIAFTASMLRRLPEPDHQSVKGLVIAPSRELVIQIAEVVRTIATGYKTVAFYGGHSMADEVNSLTPCPDIIVATPGRLLDHMQRGQLTIDRLVGLVFDEYDKSLELGFEGEIKRIMRHINHPRFTILTSATPLLTIPDYLQLGTPNVIDHSSTSLTPRSRTEYVQVLSYERDKLQSLTDLLLSFPQDQRSIVFVNHRESAERVYNRLRSLHIPGGLYHGGLEQIDRNNAIDMLANGTTPVLVATDLAARGLDIDGIDNVIHYHMPVSSEAWTHRNGRTARQDASGTIYVITSDSDTMPDFVTFDREYVPNPAPDARITSQFATLFISAGKKEKISRGDIVGFLIANAGLRADEIGMIALRDHNALVAVPRSKAAEVLRMISDKKLKGKRVKISLKK